MHSVPLGDSTAQARRLQSCLYNLSGFQPAQEHNQPPVLLPKALGRLAGLGSAWDSEELGMLGGTGETSECL